MSDDHQRPDMSDPDRTPDTALSLQEAAAWAKVNERTLRRWITSGRLPAVKDDGQYRIVVADLEHARRATPGAIRTPDTSRPGARAEGPDMSDTPASGHRAPDTPAPDIVPGFDLAPLVSHIATLEDQVQRLTEATTMWQIRARQAEEQLKQLTAGKTPAESLHNPGTIDPEGPQLLQESEPAPTGIAAWFRRLWGG